MSLRLVHEAAPGLADYRVGIAGGRVSGALSVQYRSADAIEDGERHAHWAQHGVSYVTNTSFRLADVSLFQNKTTMVGGIVGVLGVFLTDRRAKVLMGREG